MIVKKANVFIVDTGTFRPVIVELVTDEGISGIGEAAVGFGVGCHGAAHMAKELLERFVVGKDPFPIRSIWNDFYYDTFWGKGAGAIFYAAVSAIEQALWDIKGKALAAPVYELLGGKQRDKIQVYANGWSEGKCRTAQDFVDKSLEVLESGYTAMKMYPLSKIDPIRGLNRHIKNREVTLEDFKMGVDAVRLVREAVGPDIDLLVDVTAEGTTDKMFQFAQAIEPYDPYWFEEAMDAFDIDAYITVRQKTSLTLATGERLYTRYGFRPLFESRAVDIVQPDPGTCGGIMELIHIAATAETYHMKVAPHNCGGPVLCAAAVQVATCVSNLAIQEIFPFQGNEHYAIVTDPLEKKVKNGYLDVPTTPGLGVELNHDYVNQFKIASLKHE